MSGISDPSAASNLKSPRPKAVFGAGFFSNPERCTISRTWPLLFLIVAAMLFCRGPGAILHPALYAEDGTVFFKQQYEMGFWAALVTRYAGYLHFAPRIAAALCACVPLEQIPRAYAVVSLLIAAGTLTFFLAPGFRAVIASDCTRAAVVVLFTLMPNAEALMKLAYLNWYMLFFTTQLAFFTLPKKPLARWLLFLPAAIAAWSNPVTIVCLPLMLLRCWKSADWMERAWWGALMLMVIGFSLAAEHPPSVTQMVFHERSWKWALLHAIGYRVFCFFFLSSTLCYPTPGEGWKLAVTVSLALVAVCCGVAARSAAKTRDAGISRFVPFMLLYLIVALPAPFVLRKEWLHNYLAWNLYAWLGHERYFYCSTLLLCIFCGVVYARIARDWLSKSARRREMAAALFACWLVLHALGFRLHGWQTQLAWRDSAAEIRDAEAQVLRDGGSRIVHLENGAADFDFDLVVDTAAAKRDQPLF